MKKVIDPEFEEVLLNCLPKGMKQVPLSTSTASASNMNNIHIQAKSAKSEDLLITPEKVFPKVS